MLFTDMICVLKMRSDETGRLVEQPLIFVICSSSHNDCGGQFGPVPLFA